MSARQTSVPRQPANRHVLGQAERWGWKILSRKRDMVQVRHLISREKLDLQPEGSHAGNTTEQLRELYRITGVTAEGFWQGPSAIAIAEITRAHEVETDRRARGARVLDPLTTSVADALDDAAREAAIARRKAAEKADELGTTEAGEPAAEAAYGSPLSTVTPRTEESREFIVEAAKMSGGASISNQAFIVLAKFGMPMTTQNVNDRLPHLEKSQVQNALTRMSRIGTITRIQKGLYQTKAAPISGRNQTEVTSPDGLSLEVTRRDTRRPAMADMPHVPTTPSPFSQCGDGCSAASNHSFAPGCALYQPRVEEELEPAVAEPIEPAEAPQSAPSTPPTEQDDVSVIDDDELDELIDLIFPEGFRFKARHLTALAAWKQATRDMITAITAD